MTKIVPTKHVRVLHVEEYAGGWPPSGLAEFVKWAQGHLDSIPEAFRSEAKLSIESEFDKYCADSHHPTIEIFYYRPETAAETKDRIAQKVALDDTRKANELRMLKELQAKYPEGA